MTDWVRTVDPVTGGPARRETNTMPQWAGSCWYYLRFVDPGNGDFLVDKELEKYWLPVDLYVGGAEHAVLHLLYARFWHKVLFDIGVVTEKEPFQKLVSQGMILGEVEFTACRDKSGAFTSAPDDGARSNPDLEIVKLTAEDVVKKGDGCAPRKRCCSRSPLIGAALDRYVLKADERVRVSARAHKMSKSRGNVINPDDVVDSYGARSALLSCAIKLSAAWQAPTRCACTRCSWARCARRRYGARAASTACIASWAECGGCTRRMHPRAPTRRPARSSCECCMPPSSASRVRTGARRAALWHALMARMRAADTEEMRFNTAISAMMEFVNAATKWDTCPRSVLEPFALLLAPYAPHVAEELWSRLGHAESLAYAPWPPFEERHLVQSTVRVAVQVNGKMRGTVDVPADASEEQVVDAAVGAEGVAKWLEGMTVKRRIFVPGRLLNLVVAK
jgi:leucyl-tRNA synthetase